jgi:hypothetical protein
MKDRFLASCCTPIRGGVPLPYYSEISGENHTVGKREIELKNDFSVRGER